MNWLREAATDSRTQMVSSKRVVMLLAGLSMSVAVVLLAIASLLGHSVSAEMLAVAGPLAGMSGYSYVQGKAVEGRTA